MSRKISVAAVLASVGIVYSGSVTPDLVAFAGAVQKQDRVALFDFVSKHPESAFVPDAIILAGVVFCDRDPVLRLRDPSLRYRDECDAGDGQGLPDSQSEDAAAPAAGDDNGGGDPDQGGGFDGGTSV